MVTTTFRLAREAGACPESYRQYAKHVGGVKKYGQNTPIPLTEIADILSLPDALWCLCCTQDQKATDKLARLLAADFAEHVLPIFEKHHPQDDRPRKAIEAARLFAEGKIGDTARAAAGAARDAAWAAEAAAWAAAWAAAGAAAGAAEAAAEAAAWAAARAADGATDGATAEATEQEWQLKRLKEVA